MNRLGAPLLVLACVIGIGADAPPSAPANTPIETKVGNLGQACLATKDDTVEEAKAALIPCQKLIDDLIALKADNAPLVTRDLNAVLMFQSMGESRIGGAYATIDKVRSARVCAAVEREWTAASQLDKTNSPYADSIEQMVKSVTPVVTVCRKENGAPPGGAKLP